MNTDTKKYKLLKDICSPIFTIPKGTVFAKTGSAINGAYTYGNDGMYPLHPTTVENKPEWFELIPEQSKTKVQEERNDNWESDKEFYHAMGVLMFTGLGDIANKIIKSKAKAKLEKWLNENPAKSPETLTPTEPQGKVVLFTTEDLLKAERKGFDAGRYVIPPYAPYKVGDLCIAPSLQNGLIYRTFEDYKADRKTIG